MPTRNPVTVAQVEAYMREHEKLVKGLTKQLIATEIDKLTVKELLSVFRTGRETYGGEFDVQTIPAWAELKKEAADACWYVLFLLFQDEH